MRWRSHLPPEDCPPEDALPVEGYFYRLIKKQEIEPVDFWSLREKNLKGKLKGPECQACGLSIFSDLDGILAARDTVPAFKNRLIAKGKLESEHGKVQNTHSPISSTHFTWWINAEIDPLKLFKIIDPLKSG